MCHLAACPVGLREAPSGQNAMPNRATWSGLRRLSTTAALAAALAYPGVASAAGPRIVVARAKFVGVLDDDVRERFETRLSEGLDGEDIDLVRNYGAACEDRECFEALAEEDSAEFTVALSVSARERVYEMSVKLVAADGQEVAEHTDVCEICGPDEAAASVVPLAEKIREEIEAQWVGMPRLAVTSTPSGAQVFIDGDLVGTTPIDVVVNPGSYEVRVGGDGLVAEAREVQFEKGEREELDFMLSPVGAANGDRAARASKPHRPLIIAGAVTLGLGVGALGAGIPLIAIDGQQNKSRCSGDNVDEDGRCRYSYETMALGLGLAAGGGALAVIGAVLLGVGVTRKKKSKSKKTETSLLLSPTELGLRVAF